MNAFDYLIKALWDIGFFTIALPFLLVLIISFYMLKWFIEEKNQKKGKKWTLLRYALTITISLLVLYSSIMTTAVGAAFGFIIGITFLVLFLLFVFVLLVGFMGDEEMGKKIFK